MTVRSRMRSIMIIIRPEHPELFALELGKIAEFDFDYTLASTSINQSEPKLVRMNTTIRSRMSLIMDIISPEYPELFALELGKIAELDFVYTLASTSINQSVPNLVPNLVKMKSDEFCYGSNWTRTV